MRNEILIIIAACCCPVVLATAPAHAQHQQRAADSEYKTGIGKRGADGLNGPGSVASDLEENDRRKTPAFEFPSFDRALAPWFAWKGRLADRGFALGTDYVALSQGASDSLTGTDNAASGIFRVFANWDLVNRGEPNTGSLVLKVENRHRLGTDVAPAGLANEIGYLGITGTLFSDVDWILNDSYWKQRLGDGRAGFVAGRYDPNDFMDVNGYANPWTGFQNAAVLLNLSIATPDTSWGFGAGGWLNEQVGLVGSINDANGVVTETDWFKGGSDFFKQVGIVWTPSREQRFSNAVMATLWHVDQREDAGVPKDYGLAVNGNWIYDNDQRMVYGRLGVSDGAAALYRRTATIGYAWLLDQRTDTLAVGLNWGDVSTPGLRDQTTVEVFYRFQFAQNLALTPSVQYLNNPALNPDEDDLLVLGMRLRITL